MTKDEARDLVGMLVMAWPRPPIEKGTVHAYAFALGDLDVELAKDAVLRLMQTSRFLPTIAEIREAAVKNRVTLPSPEEAWGMVRRAIGRHGVYQTPVFDCDEVQAAVDAIGWKSICTDENEAATRARFCAAMQSFTTRRMEAEASGRYIPAERQLPDRASASKTAYEGGEKVLVETGYATERRHLRALPAENTDAAVAELGASMVGALVGKWKP